MLNQSIPMVLPIHTAIAGRARYKITGLWRSESLKRFLESQLAVKQDILQVRGNIDSGNLLVFFSPRLHYQQVAEIIDGLISIYRQNLGVFKPQSQTNQPLIPALSYSSLAVGFATATAVIYSQNWDELVWANIGKLQHPLVEDIMFVVTLLGEPAILLGLAWNLHRLGLFVDRPEVTKFVSNATLSAIALNLILKSLFARKRPTLGNLLANRVLPLDRYSFPSGHAMVSVVTYGAIAYLLAQEYPQNQQEIFLFVALLITGIGFSRLYLGVHWLSDITAGYAAGLLLLAGLILVDKQTASSI